MSAVPPIATKRCAAVNVEAFVEMKGAQAMCLVLRPIMPQDVPAPHRIGRAQQHLAVGSFRTPDRLPTQGPACSSGAPGKAPPAAARSSPSALA